MKGERTFLILCCVLLLLIVRGTQLGSASAQQSVSVEMKNIQFVPAVVEINVGDTVTWTNTDPVQHTVTSATKDYNFSSSFLGTGESFSVTFDKPGVVEYYCEVHPNMIGYIYVGVNPPQSTVGSAQGSSPGMTLTMKPLGDGRLSLVASLDQFGGGLTAGVPVSFFGRFEDNQSTFWVKLYSAPTQSDGSAQFVFAGNSSVTAFQAFAYEIGASQGVVSNVIELTTSAGSPHPVSSYATYAVAAAAGTLFAAALLWSSRKHNADRAGAQ